MGCACRGGIRAGTQRRGVTVLGFEVTYTDNTKHEGLFLTALEAKAEIRRAGGGTVRQITDKS